MRFIYQKSDGYFLGTSDQPLVNPVDYGEVDLARHPNQRTEKYKASGDNIGRRTAAEIAAHDAADPVLVAKGKRDAAIARGQASLDQPVTASDLFDILGIEVG